MFDTVIFKTNCPVCGCEVNKFQTKDGDNVLDYIEPLSVNNFYDYCPECECWIEYVKLKNGNYLRQVMVNDEIDGEYTEEIKI